MGLLNEKHMKILADIHTIELQPRRHCNRQDQERLQRLKVERDESLKEMAASAKYYKDMCVFIANNSSVRQARTI